MLIDKRLIGESNALAILDHLRRFGWLTSRMIAALVWPTARQSLAMARRTLRALLDDKLLLRRPLPDGGDCYTLSAAGAAFLNEVTGLLAKSGASLPLGNPVHRACSNWYLIRHLREGTDVWTEHEIQSGRAPVKTVNDKTPDGLVGTPDGLIWVEVENSWKNRKERAKVIHFCYRNILPSSEVCELAPDYYLSRVAIVGTNQDALRAIVRSFADAHDRGDLSESQAADIDLVLLPVNKSLIAGEASEGNLWHDGILPALAR